MFRRLRPNVLIFFIHSCLAKPFYFDDGFTFYILNFFVIIELYGVNYKNINVIKCMQFIRRLNLTDSSEK